MQSITLPKFIINRIQIFCDVAEIIIIIDTKIYYIESIINDYSEIKELHNLLLTRKIKSIKFYNQICIIFDDNTYALLGNNYYNKKFNTIIKNTLQSNEFICDFIGDGYTYIYAVTNQNNLINLLYDTCILCDEYWYGIYFILIRRKNTYFYIYMPNININLESFEELNDNHNKIKKILCANKYIIILFLDTSIQIYKTYFNCTLIKTHIDLNIDDIYGHYLNTTFLYKTNSNIFMFYNIHNETNSILNYNEVNNSLNDNEQIINHILGGNMIISRTSQNRLLIYGDKIFQLNIFPLNFCNDINQSIYSYYKLLFLLNQIFINNISKIIINFISFDSLLLVT